MCVYDVCDVCVRVCVCVMYGVCVMYVSGFAWRFM